jgi:Arc/MetJ family transcription regulator
VIFGAQSLRWTGLGVYDVYPLRMGHISMRTNIEIDDKLMRQALAASGLRTKRAVVEEGLRLLLRLKQQEKLKAAFGELPWDGDLDAMRRDRRPG